MADKIHPASWYLLRLNAARRVLDELHENLDGALTLSSAPLFKTVVSGLAEDCSILSREINKALIARHQVGLHETGQTLTDDDTGDVYDLVIKIERGDPPSPKLKTDWPLLGSRLAALAADRAMEGERPENALARIMPTVVPMTASVTPKIGGMKALGLDFDKYVKTEPSTGEPGPPRVSVQKVKRNSDV